jgi:hypothetical protein
LSGLEAGQDASPLALEKADGLLKLLLCGFVDGVNVDIRRFDDEARVNVIGRLDNAREMFCPSKRMHFLTAERVDKLEQVDVRLKRLNRNTGFDSFP